MDTVFISYSHQDEDWKDRIQSHLGVLESHGKLRIWDDRQIPLGGDWFCEIEQSLEQASIALLLVSRHFLNSDFIRNEEIPKLLQQRGQSGLRVIPVILSPCSWDHVDWLAAIQGYPKDNKPLSGMSAHHVDEALAKLVSYLPSSGVNLGTISTSNDSDLVPQISKLNGVTINNFSGITLEQYEDGLLRQEKRLRDEFRSTLSEQDPAKEKILKVEIEAVQDKLLNLQSSYQSTQERLKEADDALMQLKEELPDLQIEKARELLHRNETQAAKQAFTDIVEKNSPSMALAAYESGKLEEGDINYSQSMKQYRIAATLEDNNPEYLCAAGAMAQILGDYSSALSWLEALMIIRLKSGEDHLELALAQDYLGGVYEETCEYAKAESLYQRSLSIKESSLGMDDPAIATTLNDLANLHRAQGEYAKAEPLYQRSLVISEKVHGKDHSSVGAVLNNLAQMYTTQGEFAKARPLYQRSQIISEKAYGKDHPMLAAILNNLAGFYKTQGMYSDEYEEIESLYKRSLIISENSFGKDHPSVATTLCNLAEFYREKGEYAQAKPLYEQSLNIMEKSFGKNHLSVAISLNNLALLYQAQGEYEKAKPLHERDLAISETYLGKGHPDVAMTLRNLGNLYRAEGQYAKAEPMYQRSIKIMESLFGKYHLEIATTLNNLAELYLLKGELAKAEPLYLRDLEISEKKLGKDHPDVATTLGHIAILYNRQGKLSEAFKYSKRAVRIFKKVLPATHPDLVMSKKALKLLKSQHSRL